MFGSSSKQHDIKEDVLTVQVHTVSSPDAFKMAQKIWGENSRLLRADANNGKEYLHFAYASPKCVVWLQRDQGRTDAFELVVLWEEGGQHEVYVITASTPVTNNDKRAQELLHSILTIPSIVPSGENKVQ